MVRTVIVQQLEDGENIYHKGDRIRVKMKPRNKDKPEKANEYIGEIVSIAENRVVINIKIDTRSLEVNKIDKIRFARPDETFIDTWDF